MPFVAAKCTECGANIQVDNTAQAGICQHCGTAFVTKKAVHNYNTYLTQNITNTSSDGQSTVELLANAEVFAKLGDWSRAMSAYEQVTEREPANYLGWLGMMRCQTRDYTDLDDYVHIEYYRRTVAVADEEQRRLIAERCDDFVSRSQRQRQQNLLKETKAGEDEMIATSRKSTRWGVGFVGGLLLTTLLLFLLMCAPAMATSSIAQDTSLQIQNATFVKLDAVSDYTARYRIQYKYVHNGQNHIVWSDYLYSWTTAKDYQSKGYFQVRVSSDGQAVDINYRAYYSELFLLGLIFGSLTAVTAVILTLVYLRIFAERIYLPRLIREGQVGTARFVDSAPKGHMNIVRIRYTDQQGTVHETWAKLTYNDAALVAIRDMTDIPIKYIGPLAMLQIPAIDQHLQLNRMRLLGG